MTDHTYRGWSISLNYINEWDATGPNYDASYEGEEDGWVSNGHCVSAATLDGVKAEIDNWYLENEAEEREVARLIAEPFKQIADIFARAAERKFK